MKYLNLLRPIVFIVFFFLCSCNNETLNNNNTQETTSKIPVNKTYLEGFWHDALDFYKGIGTSYEFFGDGMLYNFKNGDVLSHSGSWNIRDGNKLELTVTESLDKTSSYDYNIEYIAIDESTKEPALIIGNQKFWKMNKPQDLINGSPLYINLDHNLKIKNYENKKAIKFKNIHGSGEHIIIFSDSDLYDFKISNISFDDDINFYFEDVAFSLNVLSSENFLEYKTTTPEGAPYEAISFTDKDGIDHSYALSYNGRDGSTCAVKIKISNEKNPSKLENEY